MAAVKNTYRATASREDGWWVVHIPALDRVTQSRRLEGVEATARDLIALWLDVPADSFDVKVEVELGSELAARVERVKSLRAEVDRVQAEASEAMRVLARSLAERGLSMRDAGRVLGVSFQRVQQLMEDAGSPASAGGSLAPMRTSRAAATNRRAAAKATTRKSAGKARAGGATGRTGAAAGEGGIATMSPKKSGSKATGKARSAVKAATAKRNPKTTLVERSKKSG